MVIGLITIDPQARKTTWAAGVDHSQSCETTPRGVEVSRGLGTAARKYNAATPDTRSTLKR
eukprot:3908824-Pyramimonas_sp.AAC.1